MASAKLCPTCDGVLEFIGSVSMTVHPDSLDDDSPEDADRYDCDSGHSVLVIPQIKDEDTDDTD